MDDNTFVGRLQRNFGLLLGGILQFHYRDGVVIAADQGGYILTKEEFEELITHWRLFYEGISEEDIESHNSQIGMGSFRTVPKIRAQKTKSDSGYVYILQAKEYFKIGKTKDLDRRLTQISPQLPFEVELIHTIETKRMTELEQVLHAGLHHKRANGEWFKLEEDDLDWLKSFQG
jgi:hypothetical protein